MTYTKSSIDYTIPGRFQGDVCRGGWGAKSWSRQIKAMCNGTMGRRPEHSRGVRGHAPPGMFFAYWCNFLPSDV